MHEVFFPRWALKLHKMLIDVLGFSPTSCLGTVYIWDISEFGGNAGEHTLYSHTQYFFPLICRGVSYQVFGLSCHWADSRGSLASWSEVKKEQSYLQTRNLKRLIFDPAQTLFLHQGTFGEQIFLFFCNLSAFFLLANQQVLNFSAKSSRYCHLFKWKETSVQNTRVHFILIAAWKKLLCVEQIKACDQQTAEKEEDWARQDAEWGRCCEKKMLEGDEEGSRGQN